MSKYITASDLNVWISDDLSLNMFLQGHMNNNWTSQRITGSGGGGVIL